MSVFIDEHRDRFGVEPICRVLGVSAFAYYQRAGDQRSAREVDDERLLAVIRETHRANYEAYGYRRTWKALRRAGETAPRCRGVGDLSYLRRWEGVVSFAFVLDVFSRRVVGWQLAGHMRRTLVLAALRMALGTRDPGADFRGEIPPPWNPVALNSAWNPSCSTTRPGCGQLGPHGTTAGPSL